MSNNIFIDNPDFYPTPEEVIERMMMGEDIAGQVILEPSAGKGNIVEWLQERGATVIACENDPNIRKLLDGKCEIIGDDFLSVTSEQVSHVNQIVMNPPFSHGAEHIIHAYEIAPAGCTITALCNNDNFERWYKDKNKDKMQELVELYGRKEYLGDVFKTAERRTQCDIALVKLYKEGSGENEFDGYFFSEYDEDDNSNTQEGLMEYNVVRDLVNRYTSAVKMFDGVKEMADKINRTARADTSEYGYVPIEFATIDARGHRTNITHVQYKKELQKYYWRIIFNKLNMEKYNTATLREQMNKFIEQQSQIPFTMKNVYRMLQVIIGTTGNRMKTALSDAFDLICSFSAENSTAGEKWKTNANYMVNKKFIVPYICEGYDYSGDAYPHVKLRYGGHSSDLDDVSKALCYITGVDYSEIGNLWQVIQCDSLHKPWGDWFNWGFFRCKGFKKGTMHFEFLDEDVWFKFNYECAKAKGWALPKKTPKPARKKKAEKQTELFDKI